MGNQFYYTNASNEVIGPCTTLQLMALQKAGTLKDTSLVCADGSDDWVELKSIYPAARLAKLNKESAKNADPAATSGPENEGSPTDAASARRQPLPATRTQAAVVISLLLLGFAIPHIAALRPVERWEYKKVTFPGNGYERIGRGALKYSSIQIDDQLLNMMGQEGWEMVASHLEMETAFANFGADDQLTAIHPNIRPQSLVVLFKRRAP